MVTQKQIGDELNLSQGAVTAVLNNYSHIKIAKATRQRILETADRLGYRGKRHASKLIKKRNGVIGVLQSTGMLHVAVHRYQCVTRMIREQEYHPFVVESTGITSEMQAACQFLIDYGVEGVLVQGSGVNLMMVRHFQDAGIPIVTLASEGIHQTPQVRADVCQGMKDLTRHLIGLGYRKLKLLSPGTVGSTSLDDSPWQMAGRVQGFREAHREAGLDYDEDDNLVMVSLKNILRPYQAGSTGMQYILKMESLPEAVVCANDDTAIGAIHAARLAGVRVPEDVAITGFDNTSIGEFLDTPLTTVGQQTEIMAQTAVNLLMECIRNRSLGTTEDIIRIPCELVVRESCGAKLRTANPALLEPAEV